MEHLINLIPAFVVGLVVGLEIFLLVRRHARRRVLMKEALWFVEDVASVIPEEPEQAARAVRERMEHLLGWKIPPSLPGWEKCSVEMGCSNSGKSNPDSYLDKGFLDPLANPPEDDKGEQDFTHHGVDVQDGPVPEGGAFEQFFGPKKTSGQCGCGRYRYPGDGQR